MKGKKGRKKTWLASIKDKGRKGKKRQIDTQVPIRADSMRTFPRAAPGNPQTGVGAHKTDECDAVSAGSSEPFKG